MTTGLKAGKGHSVVGRPLQRVDGLEKALGTAVFGDDVRLSGALVGRVLRSPLPHARILRIDTARAKALPGVRAVLTGWDIPDVLYGDVVKDRRALARDKVRFVGDAVALVAAEDARTAEEALARIEVEYEELPALFDPLSALREDAPLVHEDLLSYEAPDTLERRGNACAIKVTELGDPKGAWGSAEIVLDQTFTTHEVHQGYIEPHSAMGALDPSGKVTVWTTTQGIFEARKKTAEVLGVPMTGVNIVPTQVGGGFGGKIPVLIEPLCALLARATGRPVKMTLSREEDFEGTTPRHPTLLHSRLGADRSGNLLVKEVDFYLDTGAYSDLAPMMVTARAQMALGPYRVPNARVRIFAVYTNKPSCGICRAPGGPQLSFACESQMDELARRLAVDPVELREKNSLRRGDVTADGPLSFAISLPETLRRAQAAAGPRPPCPDGRLHGRGLASSFWKGPSGAASASVKLNDDGTIHILTGSVDITGSSTAIAQVVAEEMGAPFDRVRIITGDTDSASLCPGSGGSQITRALSTAAQKAARAARGALLETAAQKLEAHPEDLDIEEGRVFVRATPEKGMTFAQVAAASRRFHGPIGGYGSSPDLPAAPIYVTQIADVAVDPETGQVDVLRVVSVQDVGFAINPLCVEGQIEGGVLQGIGYALAEEMVFDGGRLVNPNLEGYILPTARDAVEVVPLMVEEPAPEGAFGVRGVGEPPIVCTAAAIANAVFDATGVRMTDLPLTPERVLRGLRGLASSVR